MRSTSKLFLLLTMILGACGPAATKFPNGERRNPPANTKIKLEDISGVFKITVDAGFSWTLTVDGKTKKATELDHIKSTETNYTISLVEEKTTDRFACLELTDDATTEYLTVYRHDGKFFINVDSEGYVFDESEELNEINTDYNDFAAIIIGVSATKINADVLKFNLAEDSETFYLVFLSTVKADTAESDGDDASTDGDEEVADVHPLFNGIDELDAAPIPAADAHLEVGDEEVALLAAPLHADNGAPADDADVEDANVVAPILAADAHIADEENGTNSEPESEEEVE